MALNGFRKYMGDESLNRDDLKEFLDLNHDEKSFLKKLLISYYQISNFKIKIFKIEFKIAQSIFMKGYLKFVSSVIEKLCDKNEKENLNKSIFSSQVLYMIYYFQYIA